MFLKFQSSNKSEVHLVNNLEFRSNPSPFQPKGQKLFATIFPALGERERQYEIRYLLLDNTQTSSVYLPFGRAALRADSAIQSMEAKRGPHVSSPRHLPMKMEQKMKQRTNRSLSPELRIIFHC
jgi:hypothetical protein